MSAPRDAIVVLNAGSSSLKFSVFDVADPATPLARGRAEGLFTAPRFVARDAAGSVLADEAWPEGTEPGHAGALDKLVQLLRERMRGHRLAGVGHRVVHGGREHAHPVLVDRSVVAALRQYIPLAPLHQPHNLRPIEVLLERLPGLPQVACFDTAFHRTQPPIAQAYALPRAITDKGVQRYGFHGLSYEHIAAVLPGYDPAHAAGKVVVLHLGNGASMCALQAGRSVASTMGFTAADGLPMGTRCGNLDPGVVLYLIDVAGMTPRAVERMIYEESGLLGVSGLSSDMRVLEASEEPRAREAIELFAYRIGRELGSLAAALGGVDALVFTGGIGENSRSLRERVCRDAAWLGVALDADANARHGPRISAAGSRVAAWVIPTDEEATIARHTRALLGVHLGHATAPLQSSTPDGRRAVRSTIQGAQS
jgi:acetate kinase